MPQTKEQRNTPESKARRRANQIAFRKRRPEYQREWCKKNPEKVKAINEKWNRKNNLKMYGIDPDIYKTMFDAQQGCCQICHRHQREFKRRLSVDHDHLTGKVRGLLCASCNSGLGQLHDSPDLLRFAAEYIEHYRTESTPVNQEPSL